MATADSTGEEQMTQRILRISDIAKEPLEMLMPITGYEDMPLVSLDAAVQPLVSILPAVRSYAYSATQRCKKPPPDGLTIDESASIMLYSMGWKPLDKCLYIALNDTLRSEDREKLGPWFLYLKLFLTALSRLPNTHQFVYRGVKLDISEQYRTGETIVWWGFSSCTGSLNVLQSELFLGTDNARTLFAIECYSGKDIHKHSFYPKEDEILLLAAAQFQVRGCLNQGNGLHMIQLRETEPPFPLLHPILFPYESSELFYDDEMKQKSDTKVTASKSKFYRFQRAVSHIIGKRKRTRTNATPDSIRKPGPLASDSTDHRDTTWIQGGVTVAGGNKQGNGLHQFARPSSVYVDDDQTMYIADKFNHRVMQWKCRAPHGQVMAGGNGQDATNQLNWPTDVIVDKERNHLIICDKGNGRVVRWSRQNDTYVQTIIANINCSRLTIDKDGYVYISDCKKQEVRRWKMNETDGTLVAGGKGRGNRFNQLNYPTSIFVDQDRSVYVSDRDNHRVMKWMEGADEGIIVAGGQGKGKGLTQLSDPAGLVVNQMGTIYVADSNNHRIMRWSKGATQGDIVGGGNGQGKQANQLSFPSDLSFDLEQNIYVVDSGNHRIQKFTIDQR